MNANAPLQSIVVVGGGFVAMSAALAFSRALPAAKVVLVPTGVQPSALSDQFPSLRASIRHAVGMWGLDERDLLAAGATPRLGERFEGWGASTPWMTAPGTAAQVPGSGALHQRWLRASLSGEELPAFHDLLPAAAMAAGGRFATNPPPALHGADYDLVISARLLSDLLAARLEQAGIEVAGSDFAAAETDGDGAIAGIYLVGQAAPLRADFFVDATGPSALLIEKLAVPFESWSDWLADDRLLVARHKGVSVLHDTYHANDHGWRSHWARGGQTLSALAYAGTLTQEESARCSFGPRGNDALLIELHLGRRRNLWTANCLALGEAAVQPGALGLLGFSLAQTHLALAIELLPGRNRSPALIAEYNRRASQSADRLRDWLVAHQRATPVRPTPFWQGHIPSTLADRIEQFEQRGFLPSRDEDMVAPDAWHAVLIGQGLRSRRADPLALAGDARLVARDLRDASLLIRSAVEGLPSFSPPPPGTGKHHAAN